MQLDNLFNAKSFAIVGASTDKTKVGHQILFNLMQNHKLEIYPVNPKGGEIEGLSVYPNLMSVPKPVDVVIIAVKAQIVPSIVDDCLSIKPKAVVIISAGFAEIGESGRHQEQLIVKLLADAGIVLLGPNTIGYVCPSKHINASFGPQEVNLGDIAIISQSGAMLSSLFSHLDSVGLGVSFALSLGNNVGLGEIEALEYAASDPNTKVVAIYLESIKDPKLLLQTARKCSASKPIFLLKGGVTDSGQLASNSHTAAKATSPVLLSALCAQAGITQISNFEQLVSSSIMSSKLAHLPENVMILTNAGGLGVTLADHLASSSLKLATISSSTKANLALELPELSPNNPLDLLGDATPNTLHTALDILTVDHMIDLIAVLITKQAVTDLDGITQILQKPHNNHKIIICLSGGDDLLPYKQQLISAGYLVFDFPSEISESLSYLAHARKNILHGPTSPISNSMTAHPYPKTYTDLEQVISSLNVITPKNVIVSEEADLNKLTSLHFPLVAKTASLEIIHKLKSGGLILDIVTPDQAHASFESLKPMGDILFQEKLPPSPEILLGAIDDPFWGWYVTVGIGGSISDTINDRAYIFDPASNLDIQKALSRTKLYTLLNSEMSHKLVMLVQQFISLVKSIHGISELEINPLFVKDPDFIAIDIKRK